MNYWYLGAAGTQVQMFTDIWGNWVTAEGDEVNVDNAGNVTTESGDWLGTVYGDSVSFLEETRDQLISIPADSLNRAAVTIPITIAVSGLAILWYFFRK